MDHIRNQCTDYIARFEGTLSDYEMDIEVDDVKYNQFIQQIIKDRLFNNLSRFNSFDSLPEKLGNFLQLVDWEIVPIEIGKTETNARLHDIQSSQQTGVAPGTVAEVILPGLRGKTDGVIVQKPVVIRGE